MWVVRGTRYSAWSSQDAKREMLNLLELIRLKLARYSRKIIIIINNGIP